MRWTVKLCLCLTFLLPELVITKMVMNETSCNEVEEEECGVCHTIYMPECEMIMVEEMMPTKLEMCKNVTMYEDNCQTVMETLEVEERRPICKVKQMNMKHKACTIGSNKGPCLKVMKCHLAKQMIKKELPRTKCDKTALKNKKEKCFETIQLKKEMHEKKSCSFYPKTICHDSEGKKCRKVKKKMCNYINTNQL